MKSISCFFFFFLVYTNCACGAEWSGLGRLYFGTAHTEFSLYIYFSDPQRVAASVTFESNIH